MKKGFIIALLAMVATVGNVFSQSMLISGGNDHALALCNKGKIFAWGYNKDNQLGLLPPNDTKLVVNKPEMVNIPINLTFSQVSAGSGSHNVALSCKKIAYGWGANKNFEAGQPTGDVIDKPTPILCGEAGQYNHGYEEDGITPGPYLGDVKKIAATTSASIALLEDGTAVIWGGNGSYQGGDDYPLFKQKTYKPIYVRDENNKILTNIIDAYGGDNNLTLIVGNSPTDMIGTVYSMGNWNGRGATDKGIDESCFVAKPVILAAPNSSELPSDDNKTLTAVKTSGIADAGGFAFDENEGYLYGWGNNGWHGMVGVEKLDAFKYASKVLAGEYATISKETYMTNVHQVVGGNGYGAVVTEDGYMLYMGVNNLTGRDGGIIPNSEWSATITTGTSTDPGPVFAKYCKGEKDPLKEVVVNDAAAIGRGDLFGFMVNKDGDFYVWGNTKGPGDSTPAEVGLLGLGFDGKADDPEGKGYRTCLSKITLDCDPQDECPKVYMIGPRYKCPGKKDSLYCGFTPTTRAIANYYFKWSHNGKVKGNVTQAMAEDLAKKISDGTATAAEKKAVLEDPWNNWIVEVSDPGTYTVEIIYVGNNVPCSNCESAIGKVEVIDMEMPIDIDTLESCVVDTMKPANLDIIDFSATVNDKFYKATDKVTFAAFATPTSTDTLKDIYGNTLIFNTTGAGGIIDKFSVYGDIIDKTIGVEPRPGIDTLYHIWLEDITKFETNVLEPSFASSTGSGQRDLILKTFSTSEFSSFYIHLIGTTYSETQVSIKPIIYRAGKAKDGNYTHGELFWEGETKDTTIVQSSPAKEIDCEVKCGVTLPGNSARGTEYVLSAIITITGGGTYSLNTLPATTNFYFATPIEDSKGYGIQITGTYAANPMGGGYSNNDGTAFYNLKFGKMTDYNCGRIPLSSRFYCPPCDSPRELEITSSESIKNDVDPKYKKVVTLCKESDELTLDIEPLIGKASTDTKFDIMWFDKKSKDESEALSGYTDLTGDAKTLEFKTDWATIAGATDITESVEKVYYVMVRDHKEKSCETFDSIKVIAHPVPADTLVWDTFCLTSRLDEPRFVASPLSNKDIHWVGDDPTVASVWASITAPTTFDYTITDKVTTCVGETHSYTVTVNKTPLPGVETMISQTKETGLKYQLANAIIQPDGIADGCEINWYETETGTTEITSVPLDEKGTITVWAEQYDPVTKCSSERVEVTIVINDTPMPDVVDESLCIGDEIIDMAEYATAKDANHTLNFYKEKDDVTPLTDRKFTATEKGEFTFWVSQTNNDTQVESEKRPLTITVHGVSTLDLSDNVKTYCIGDPTTDLTAKIISDEDPAYINVIWSQKQDMSNPKSTMTPKATEETTETYYARADYNNSGNAQNTQYASAVCEGKVEKVEITINKTEIPKSNTNYTVSYLLTDAVGNKYKKLLDQEGDAVIEDNGCELIWYDKNMNKLDDMPAPEYNSNDSEREEIYYVAQKNTTTTCTSEPQKVVVSISSILKPSVSRVALCESSEKLLAPYPLDTFAHVRPTGSYPESDYELVWYKEDPKTGATPLPSIDLSDEIKNDISNGKYDSKSVNAYDRVFWVTQKYIGTDATPGESPAEELNVTIYSKPRLKLSVVEPVCKGTQIPLDGLYSISNQIPSRARDYKYTTLSSSGGSVDNADYLTEHGDYLVSARFEITKDEVCISPYDTLKVTVNEIKSVLIDGDKETCPSTGVDLVANVDYEHMSADDVNNASYTWHVSPSGVSGNFSTFNTSDAGLLKKGDKVTVTLEVEMGKCTSKATHVVSVIDPGIVGISNQSATISFEEKYNDQNATYQLSANSINEFNRCNNNVEVAFKVQQTEDEFSYENLETGEKGTGTFSDGTGKFGIKAGMYEVTYTNTCPTKFKFNVIDRFLNIKGNNSSLAVCEGSPFSAKIVKKEDDGSISPFDYDPRKHTIEWQKDGLPISGQTTEELYIPATTPNDNGVYSFKVTTAGCNYFGSIAGGGSFTSKPNVKIDSTKLGKDGVFEVVRTKDKEITLSFKNPTNTDYLDKLEKKILWFKDGESDASYTGSKVTLKNVTEDQYYHLEFAKGSHRTDGDFCGSEVDIVVKVDALLSIKSKLINADGTETSDMCINEDGVGFEIDTTGTGTVLNPDKFRFKVMETIGSETPKEIKMVQKEDDPKLLFAEITPAKDATYKIIYEYDVEGQNLTSSASIKVHPAYEIEWDKNIRLCDGMAGFIPITKAEPASEITLTWLPNSHLMNGDKNGANVIAKFAGDGLVKVDTLELLVSSNEGFCADKVFKPTFTTDKQIEGKVVIPELICEGHTAIMDASSYEADEYIWSSFEEFGEGVTKTGSSLSVIPKSMYPSYDLEMKRGACTESEIVDLTVSYAPVFDRIDSLSFRSVEIFIQPGTGTKPFRYIVDDVEDDNVLESIKENLDYGNHHVKVIDMAGCEIDTTFVTLAPDFEFPVHISPNGDGKDDLFSIPTLTEAYPDANIRIFDRWGKKLAEYKAGDSEMDWDGTYMGKEMPTTDYWYEIEIKEIKKLYVGHFTLIRQ